MAAPIRIDADAEWFVGEDRILRFWFDPDEDTDGIDEWVMVAQLFARRAVEGDEPLLEVPAQGYAAVPADPDAVPPVAGSDAVVIVTFDGDDTTELGPGVYQLVLRTQNVLRSVLAFGPVEIRSAVNA